MAGRDRRHRVEGVGRLRAATSLNRRGQRDNESLDLGQPRDLPLVTDAAREHFERRGEDHAEIVSGWWSLVVNQQQEIASGQWSMLVVNQQEIASG